jgi:hypothetical protein
LHESFKRVNGASDHNDNDLRRIRFSVLYGAFDMSVDTDFIYEAKERRLCGRETPEDTEILAHWARLIHDYPAIEVTDDDRQGCDA